MEEDIYEKEENENGSEFSSHADPLVQSLPCNNSSGHESNLLPNGFNDSVNEVVISSQQITTVPQNHINQPENKYSSYESVYISSLPQIASGNEMILGTAKKSEQRKSKARDCIIAEAPLLVQRRQYSIRPTTVNMSKIILDTLKGESSEIQKQMISLLSELPLEVKDVCKDNIYQTYMGFISNAFFKSISLDDASNASYMLMEIAKMSPKHADLIPTLIILTQVQSELLRYYYASVKTRKQATNMLRKYGCHTIDTRNVKDAFNSIYIQVNRSLNFKIYRFVVVS